MVKSVEPNIADLANGWLKEYKLDYKLEQESLNLEIDKALNEYASKAGGSGGNRPDAKLILQDENLEYFPILIEYKGYKDKLIKLDSDGKVQNIKPNSEPNYKNINSYAVNGAVHYANAILHYTSYTDVISIGVTGYKDPEGKLKHSIGVYYVSKDNLGIGQEVDKYSDLSFLKKENFSDFIKKIKQLSMSPEELEKLREKREKEINNSLIRLNNDIYNDEKGLSETDRVYLVVSSIIATLGVSGNVSPLEKIDLKSSLEHDNRDGDIMIRKINAFLSHKSLPETKRVLIIRSLSNTLLSENINKPVDGESQLKRVFSKIIDDLGIYYKIGLTTDFTGKLFNEMYSWLGFTQDKLNDVVLTPPYISKLLVKLARVDMNSYVWDFATGSAGLLVSAMNEMLDDAKEKIKSPEEYEIKSAQIKSEQLLGLEVLSNIYMLAILNMILMGDGSSNILNEDSLISFDGKYAYGKENEIFPANAFILNPPYSAEGNGMIFVKKALSMMNRGYASVIIQSSAGSGKAREINQEILKNSTLIASIKMPVDVFIGKSNVQTNIYVFRVGEPHHKDEIVKFIDFSNDGYTRTNRRKSSLNLKDTNNAKERYQEVANLVRFGKSKLNYYSLNEYYEGTIDPQSGSDWNQITPIDSSPTVTSLKNSIADSLLWELSSYINHNKLKIDKLNQTLIKDEFNDIEWNKYPLSELFEIHKIKGINTDKLVDGTEYDYVTRTSINQGINKTTGFIENETLNKSGTWSLGLLQMDFFYRKNEWYAGQFVRKIEPKIEISQGCEPFFTVLLNGIKPLLRSVLVRDVDEVFLKTEVELPTKDGEIDFELINSIVQQIYLEQLESVKNFLNV